jgi:signal peptidase I
MSEDDEKAVPTAAKKSGRGSGVVSELVMLLVKMAAIIAVTLLIFTVMFGIFRNADISMNPAIKDADLVLFYRLDKDYVKSDVLVLKYQGKVQARRVIAAAGDTVDIKEDGLYINGFLQQEPEIYQDTVRYDTGVEFPLTVGEGQVFVLGDGREDATDSRVYGCVNVSDTLGKVMTVIRRRGI